MNTCLASETFTIIPLCFSVSVPLLLLSDFNQYFGNNLVLYLSSLIDKKLSLRIVWADFIDVSVEKSSTGR